MADAELDHLVKFQARPMPVERGRAGCMGPPTCHATAPPPPPRSACRVLRRRGGPRRWRGPGRPRPGARRRPAGPPASADKRSAILAAALGLFSRYGLHGTTVDQVAAQARVSKSNLLYHFANKEELYVQALRDLLDDWLEPLRAFSAEQDPAAAVSTYIAAKIAFSRDRPDASRLFCLEMIQGAPLLRDELAGELRRLVDAKAEVVRVWVADGRLAPVDPHHLVFALWAVTAALRRLRGPGAGDHRPHAGRS